jgi:hypothetical protein
MAEPTAFQTKPIDQVEVGDWVWTQSAIDGDIALKQVARKFVHSANHLRVLVIVSEDGRKSRLKTTDNHPFFVPGSGWTAAEKLVAGDRLLQPDGAFTTVLQSRREEHPEGITVYNFEARDYHTYFVADAESNAPPVLVHNKSIRTTSDLPSFQGQPRSTIISQLQALGFRYLGKAANGGELWAVDLPNGTTLGVRIDPPNIRPQSLNFADEVPHVHKEVFHTQYTQQWATQPGRVPGQQSLNDANAPSTSPGETHIPVNPEAGPVDPHPGIYNDLGLGQR